MGVERKGKERKGKVEKGKGVLCVYLIHGNQLDLKGKTGVGGNRDLGIWETLLAVSVLGLDNDLCLLASAHGHHGIIPTGNDVSRADSETQRVGLLLCVVVGIKDLTVIKVTGVKDGNVGTLLGETQLVTLLEDDLGEFGRARLDNGLLLLDGGGGALGGHDLLLGGLIDTTESLAGKERVVGLEEGILFGYMEMGAKVV